MERKGNDIESSQQKESHGRELACAKCCPTAKQSRGWVIDSDGVILCASYNRDLINQHFYNRYSEMFGHEMAHYFSYLHYRLKAGEKGGDESHS